MSSRGFQSLQGPTDSSLKHSEIEGYQPVSRIGEVVINSFGTPITTQTKQRTWAHLDIAPDTPTHTSHKMPTCVHTSCHS